MALYTVESLSLSKIGDLLREQLGEEATSYTFPEDFEKAVVDIGFSGLVMCGDSSPYDLVVIGGGLARMNRLTNSNAINVSSRGRYKSVRLFPGASLPVYSFYQETYMAHIELPDTVTIIPLGCFSGCSSLTRVELPNSVVQLEGGGTSNYLGAFANCASLREFYMPGGGTIYSGTTSMRGALYYLPALTTAVFGSVGHPLLSAGQYCMQSCTNTDLVVTIYTDGSHVNTLLSGIRNGATNATIIIKASSDTTYNDASYSAGDTILTSTP